MKYFLYNENHNSMVEYDVDDVFSNLAIIATYPTKNYMDGITILDKAKLHWKEKVKWKYRRVSSDFFNQWKVEYNVK